jgi:cytochrome c oxidase subunit II
MMSLVIGIGVLLVLVILFMIFRVGTLMSVMRGPEKIGGTANKINAFLFLVFMVAALVGFFWYSYSHFDSYQIPVASEHGIVTDHLFWLTMIVCVAASTVIFAAMFWITFVYQYKEGRKAKFLVDSHILELVWTGIPAVVMALLIFKGLESWNDITAPASKDAEVIELVGQQFAWTARYPGSDKQLGKIDFRLIDNTNEFGLNLADDPNTFDDFKAQELHLPKGKEVLLKIRAKDVLHSVYLPQFRVKMDAVPGMSTHFKFVPTKSTADMRAETKNPKFNYELACAEICGKGHFSMRLIVVVDELADYEKWKSEQESWLKQNPDYRKYVPEKYKEMADIKSGITPSGVAVN